MERIKHSILLPLGLAIVPLVAAVSARAEIATMDWSASAEILARIKAPEFPAREFDITKHGAVADGTTDCTVAIRSAIEACHGSGGGRVVVPAGVFITGAIHLKSNVNLFLSHGSTLRFRTDPSAYLPVVRTRWEGIECMNYSPFIYAIDEENIAVTGSGTLDGAASADAWWDWAAKSPGHKPPAAADAKALNELAEQNVPVENRLFGTGHFLRPNFFQPYRCRNVLIEGVTILRSPMWEINPVLCSNVTVRGLTIESHGPNNDGCDPDSSRDVLIEHCSFATGDDCIAIKSGRNEDGRRVGVPSENLVVRHCVMKDGHGGVVIGSEISGDCRNVFIEDCEMDSPNLERMLRFKSNARRGGTIENVLVRRVRVGRVAEAILTVDLLYEEGADGPYQPIVRHIALEDITSLSSPRVFFVAGFKKAVIDDIRVSNSTFAGVDAPEFIQFAKRIVLEDVTVLPAKKIQSLSTRADPR